MAIIGPDLPALVTPLPAELPEWATGSPLPVFAQPFMTWRALASRICEHSPEVAQIMTQSAALLLAELEISAGQLKSQVYESLSDVATRSELDTVVGELWPETTPEDPEALAAGVGQAYGRLIERVGAVEAARSLISLVVKAFTETQPERSESEYARLSDYLAKRKAGDFKLMVTASLDAPEVLGRGQTPVVCISEPRLLWQFATGRERTFQGDLRRTFTSLKTSVGHIPANYFKLDISADLPTTHFRLVTDDMVNSLYAATIVYGLTNRKLKKITAVLESRKDKFRDAVETVSKSAAAATGAVLTAHGVPPTASVAIAKLLQPLLEAILVGLLNGLAKAVGDTPLTTWLLWDTVLAPPDELPISVFAIQPAGFDSPRIKMAQPATGGGFTLFENYTDPELDRNVQFLQGISGQARDLCPEELWGLAAKAGQPVALTNPLEDNNGFHALVPHYRVFNEEEGEVKSAYVSAIRADLRSS